MMNGDRDCENAVYGIPLSYIRVEYIRHNILNQYTKSLCLTYSLCSKYILKLSDIFTMRHKELV